MINWHYTVAVVIVVVIVDVDVVVVHYLLLSTNYPVLSALITMFSKGP